MKCDAGTICDSGYTLNPDSGFSEEYVEALLNKDKSLWSPQEKKDFRAATFGCNKFTLGKLILFIICVIVAGQVVGGTIAYVVLYALPFFDASTAQMLGVEEGLLTNLQTTMMTLIVFALTFVSVIIFDKPFLNTDLRHLISGWKKFDWKLFFVMFFSCIVLIAVLSIAFGFGNIELRNLPLQFIIPSALIMLVLIPMQTTTEEIFFRCILSRFFYKNNLPSVKKGFVLIIVSGLIFMCPHLANPEIASLSDPVNLVLGSLSYFLAGAGLMASGLIAGTFVAPVAIHFANNLFLSVVITQDVSVLSAPTFFIDHTGGNLGIIAFFNTLALQGLLILICYLYTRHKNKK